MILEHDKIEVHFFNQFPSDIKKVAMFLSGGADSALILYLLSKLDVVVYPIHGYEVTMPELDSVSHAQNVLDYVRNKNPNHKIEDLFIYPMQQGEKSKYYYMKPARRYFEQYHGVAHWVFGTSRGMPGEERPTDHEQSYVGDDLVKMPEVWGDILVPWQNVDKKFIAAQYEKLGLKELSELTNSCIISTKQPCKTCWWCKERYWAFGSYDGGIQ